MKRLIRSARLACLGGCLFAANLASADAGDDAARAYQEGVAAYQRHDLTAARSAFRSAYRASPHFRVLYNIGLVENELGHAAAALRAFEGYLDEARGEVPVARRAELKEVMARLETRVGRLEVHLEVTNAQLEVDGERVAWQRGPVAVDPGSHPLVARASGYRDSLVNVSVAAGERKYVSIAMKTTAPPAEPAPRASDKVRPEPSAEPARADAARRDAAEGLTPWLPAITLYGAAAAAFVSASVTGALALSATADLDTFRAQAYPGGAADARREQTRLQDRAQSFAVASDVLWIAGLGLAGLGVLFTFWQPWRDTPRAAALTHSPNTAQQTPARVAWVRPAFGLTLAPTSLSLHARF